VGVMFLRTHFVRKSEASDMTTLLDANNAERPTMPSVIA